MANRLYKKGIQALAGGGIDLDTDTMKYHLVRGYTPNTGTHEFVSDITGGGGGTIVATTAALTGVTLTDGVVDHADPTFTSVAAGAACAHLVLFKDTGNPSTSRLFYLIDTATGLPVTPDGGNILLTVDSGSNKLINLDA